MGSGWDDQIIGSLRMRDNKKDSPEWLELERVLTVGATRRRIIILVPSNDCFFCYMHVILSINYP
jgi:hypothetical protein